MLKDAVLDKNDLKVLQKVLLSGEWWFDLVGRSPRPANLADRGLLEKKLRVWKISGGGVSVEYRQAYRLTDAGRAALSAPVKG